MTFFKCALIFALSFLYCSFSSAQGISFNINFDTTHVDKYQYVGGKGQTYLQMSYGGHRIYNKSKLKVTKDKIITKIQLVCTQYPEDGDFTLLNEQRLASLFLVAPDWLRDPSIKWELVYQTGADSETANDFFHGFVIFYTDPMVGGEHEYLSGILSGELEVKDSTVLKIMCRNTWKDMVIVTDFTGSMSPHVGEMLLWYQLYLEKNKKLTDGFVFFNDGDRKPNGDKIMGETGGIYHTDHKDLDSVLTKAVETITNGYGGDAQENDVEALLFAQKQFKTTKSFVLIADNTSNMRDYTLLEDLKRPVKVVVCGRNEGGTINTQYINLAYKTGGSIHTIEEDITDLLHEIEEDGGILDIGGQQYEFRDGGFHLLKKS